VAEQQLDLDWPIDLALTVASHGWVRLEPWRWDEKSGALQRTERIHGAVGNVVIRQHDSDALTVGWEGFSEQAAAEISNRVRRWVSADWDPAAAVAALTNGAFFDEARMVATGAGRLLRCSTFYEDFVKTLLTVNTSWAGTCRMAAALVAEPGGGAFPAPQAVIDYGEARLRQFAKLGFRAPTLVAATERMLADGAIDPEGRADEERFDYDYLTSHKGIGPYAAAHCRMLLHDFSRIPVDSVVVAHLRERHDTSPAEFIAARASCGDYLGLGYRLMRLREKYAAPELAGAPPLASAPASAY